MSCFVSVLAPRALRCLCLCALHRLHPHPSVISIPASCAISVPTRCTVSIPALYGLHLRFVSAELGCLRPCSVSVPALSPSCIVFVLASLHPGVISFSA
ncbi:hypothetical protein BDP27DRAFT_1351784 [Rhodocollybia butyracea]|uniref:Secreted protein n=1 Tax=Rhodocollybia butyracea TaxID=206335 RepID=A0A9P5TVY0_9AGAR|nr:hypothetical protein BDP27DRAFT_1351784 [Rhodocollybia butyracea]